MGLPSVQEARMFFRTGRLEREEPRKGATMPAYGALLRIFFGPLMAVCAIAVFLVTPPQPRKSRSMVREVRSCLLGQPLKHAVSGDTLVIQLPHLDEGDVLLLQ